MCTAKLYTMSLKVAIVHDWLVNYGGSERVVESLLSIYPDADIYTLVYDKKKMECHFDPKKVHTSFVQKIPCAVRLYTKMLTLMPKAFESFDFSGYDLVISSSSSCAKGVITPPNVPHIAYIHTPMRYAWDMFHEYKRRSGNVTRFFMDRWIPSIRLWDYVSSQRIDKIVCNSKYIKRRIKKFWNRDAKVIYPPVDTEHLHPNGKEPDDFYVAFSRLVPYKRMDIAIKACIKLNRHLVVIGSGSCEKELQRIARGKSNITFTGRISDGEVKQKLQACKALLFCAEEDFGIIPVEAHACGRPVIAFGSGGVTDTVEDGITGVLFKHQTVESLCNAIERFEELYCKHTFSAEEIAKSAKRFSAQHFKDEMLQAIEETISELSYGGKD